MCHINLCKKRFSWYHRCVHLNKKVIILIASAECFIPTFKMETLHSLLNTSLAFKHGKNELVKHEIVESTSRADLDFDVVAACSKCFISSFLGKAILLIIYTHFWAGLPHNLHKLEKSSFSSVWHSAVLILVNWEKVLDSAKYAHNYQI